MWAGPDCSPDGGCQGLRPASQVPRNASSDQLAIWVGQPSPDGQSESADRPIREDNWIEHAFDRLLMRHQPRSDDLAIGSFAHSSGGSVMEQGIAAPIATTGNLAPCAYGFSPGLPRRPRSIIQAGSGALRPRARRLLASNLRTPQLNRFHFSTAILAAGDHSGLNRIDRRENRIGRNRTVAPRFAGM